MKRIDELLNSYFQKINVNEGRAYSNFYKSWVNIVGTKISENSKIIDVEDGVLIIEVSHPGWKQLIDMKKNRIIRETSKLFPELNIKKINYKFTNIDIRIERKVDSVTDAKVDKRSPQIDNEDFRNLLEKMNKRSQE